MPPRFDGRKDPNRRHWALHLADPIDAHPRTVTYDVAGLPRADRERFAEYRKTQTVIACRMNEPFEVDTLEGRHTGKAGDYLAVGAHGEMYPIDAAVFEATYELA